jgi:hypothetical protein
MSESKKKFVMPLTWHNCYECPPVELFNYDLIATDSNIVFRVSYDKDEGWLNTETLHYLPPELLWEYWWADLEQTVRGCSERKMIMDKWISADQLPENGEYVLVWFEYHRFGDWDSPYQTYGISYTFNGKWSGFVNGSSGWSNLKIIAWQPLPEPPREEN